MGALQCYLPSLILCPAEQWEGSRAEFTGSGEFGCTQASLMKQKEAKLGFYGISGPPAVPGWGGTCGPHRRTLVNSGDDLRQEKAFNVRKSQCHTAQSKHTLSPPCLPSSSSCLVSFTIPTCTHTHTPSWCQVSVRFPSISRSLDCPDLQRRSYTQSASFNSRSMRVITCVCVCVCDLERY